MKYFFKIKKLIKHIIFLLAIIFIARSIQFAIVLKNYSALETQSEKINYVIAHKKILLRAYKIKKYIKTQLINFIKTSPNLNSSLIDWFEDRIIYQIECNNLQSIDKLPLFEKALLKSFEGTASIKKLSQETFETIKHYLPFT